MPNCCLELIKSVEFTVCNDGSYLRAPMSIHLRILLTAYMKKNKQHTYVSPSPKRIKNAKSKVAVLICTRCHSAIPLTLTFLHYSLCLYVNRRPNNVRRRSGKSSTMNEARLPEAAMFFLIRQNLI